MPPVPELRHARPCDCAGRYRQFAPSPFGGTQIIPVEHDHEDGWCGILALGCPGVPHCRDWILGAIQIAERLATARGDGVRAFELRIKREDWEREFARRAPLIEQEAACRP